MTDDIKALVVYRLQQAEETLLVARELSVNGHFRDAVNRAYYAMFYAGLGLLATRMLGSSKHSGVLSLFSKHFVKNGTFSRQVGKHLREAFDLRQKCDYREFVKISSEQVSEVIRDATDFISETNRVWSDIQSEIIKK